MIVPRQIRPTIHQRRLLSFFIEEPKSNHFAGKLKSSSRRSPKAPADFFRPQSYLCRREVYSFSHRNMMRGVLAIRFDCLLVSAAMSDAFGSEEQAERKA
jgi:hypothetical protein